MPNNVPLTHVLTALVLGALVEGCAADAIPPDPHPGELQLPSRSAAPPSPGSKEKAEKTDKTDSPGTAPGGGADKTAALPGETRVVTPVPVPAAPEAKAGTAVTKRACATPDDAVPAAYDIALLRAPDQPGQTYWLNQLEAGQERIEMLRNLVRSTEFTDTRAGLSDTGFLTNIYADFLGRAADAAGSAYWLDALANGTSRTTVALSFVDNSEFRSDPAHACFF